jgi:type I restriction enzyme S subunit
MREDWKTANLGEVCEMINRGISPKYIDEGGICVINQKCIRNHTINTCLARRHNLTAKLVNPERYIKVGDVLVNSTGTGTLGRVAQVRREPNEPTTVDTHVTIVRPHPGIFFNDFFGYMLVRIENEIASSGEGASGQTELARCTIAEKFRVSFPLSVSEQKRIVAILDEAFEGLIERSPTPKRTLPTPANYLKAI